MSSPVLTIVNDSNVVVVAQEVVADVGEVFKEELEGRDYFGLYFSFIELNVSLAELVIQFMAGKPNPEKIGDFRRLSVEKPSRAIRHEVNTSFEAGYNPDEKRYGGGLYVRAPNCPAHGIGASGQPETLDTVSCLVTEVRARIITTDFAARIVEGCGRYELSARWAKACHHGLI